MREAPGSDGITSRGRVADHGEVFTPPGLVRDMLDLPGVREECLRVEARFLEPACGDGNFLAEVLRRRLVAVCERHPKSARVAWERDALRGMANLYGIELLHDNVQACRDRLTALFEGLYRDRFRKQADGRVVAAATHLAAANVHLGDALKMSTVGDGVYGARPLVFTQWSMPGGGRFKRRLFEYRELLDPGGEDDQGSLFNGRPPAKRPLLGDDGKPVFLARPVGDLPVVHYLKLGDEPHPTLPRPATA